METSKFAVGSRVMWMSTSNGSTVKKWGTVIAVVPAGTEPRSALNQIPARGFRLDVPGRNRDHESYLVQVGARKLLYWPRVSLLEMAEAWPPDSPKIRF